MVNYFDKEKVSIYVKFLITFTLFFSVKDFSSIDGFSKLAVALLEFIIILELVRMLTEFLFSDPGIISILFVFRIVTMKFSPSNMEKHFIDKNKNKS